MCSIKRENLNPGFIVGFVYFLGCDSIRYHQAVVARCVLKKQKTARKCTVIFLTKGLRILSYCVSLEDINKNFYKNPVPRE